MSALTLNMANSVEHFTDDQFEADEDEQSDPDDEDTTEPDLWNADTGLNP